MWAGPDARPQLHRHTTLAIQPNYSAGSHPDYGPLFSKLVLTPDLSSASSAPCMLVLTPDLSFTRVPLTSFSNSCTWTNSSPGPLHVCAGPDTQPQLHRSDQACHLPDWYCLSKLEKVNSFHPKVITQASGILVFHCCMLKEHITMHWMTLLILPDPNLVCPSSSLSSSIPGSPFIISSPGFPSCRVLPCCLHPWLRCCVFPFIPTRSLPTLPELC